MRRLPSGPRARLVLAHVAILVLGAAAFVLLAGLFAPGFLAAFQRIPLVALVVAAAGALGVVLGLARLVAGAGSRDAGPTPAGRAASAPDAPRR
jgi:hypothetical protein